MLDLGDFLKAICHNPSIVQPELKHSNTCDVAQMHVEMSKAVPISLLAVELITNSLKYTFPDGRTGEIRVELHKEPQAATFTIRDNGGELPPAQEKPLFGLRQVEALAVR